MDETRELSAPEQLTLAFHRALVEKLRADPEAILARARHHITRVREVDVAGHSEFYTATWAALVDGPLEDLEAAMVSLSQESRDLRQASVFAGVLSDEERYVILGQVYKDQHPDATPEFLEALDQQLRRDGLRVNALIAAGLL
jgi:hypothetical protein